MLVNFFMEVFDAYHNVGVEVVATMCDVGSNKAQALKHQGVPEKIIFFMFQSQEFAPTFDLPHLLKCTYSFVLKYDVTNVECESTVNGEQLTGTTKREDEGV